jgi:hypothetical protein
MREARLYYYHYYETREESTKTTVHIYASGVPRYVLTSSVTGDIYTTAAHQQRISPERTH